MADTGDVDVAAIRSVLLEVIDGLSREYSHLQASSVLQEAVGRLANRRDLQTEQALLASFYDLFRTGDRKSTRLNSSHLVISYAVFCLKKKKINMPRVQRLPL